MPRAMERGSTEVKEEIRCIAFNEDSSALAIGTTRGCRMYTTEPFTPSSHKVCGGVSALALLDRTALYAMVGLGSLEHSPRQLQVCGAGSDQPLFCLSFEDTVLAVRLSRTRLAVVLECSVHLFDTATMAPVQVATTARNPGGLAGLSVRADPGAALPGVLAYPHPVDEGGSKRGAVALADTLTGRVAHVVHAHFCPLAAIALSAHGSRLATASEKGTVVRLFGVSAEGAVLLHLFRRGTQQAAIRSMAFGRGAALLACSSNSGTVHIFRCTADPAAPPPESAVREERSTCKLTLESPSLPHAACFTPDGHRLLIATAAGFLLVYGVDPGQPLCELQSKWLLGV
eukprot:TRINITY_DN31989_c0_g1_i1.p1 TRINITY_DN31989_c0_g1~~TRINITY_DN31989_c0_g1_i1.p1  ORF type:complete len:364 (+),score=93.42 TRINITY_DN31989_c0_g1_i1:62-1093(+)